MKLIESNIPDIDIENIDKEKVILSDKIINFIQPFFENYDSDKIDNFNTLKIQLENKKLKVSQNKVILENTSLKYNRQKKIKKLLNKITELISTKLINDNKLKHEILILVKVVDTLTNDKIDYHIFEIDKIIKKRFLSGE